MPSEAEVAQMPAGCTLVSLLQPGSAPGVVESLSSRGTNALALERVPRITRAQSMDVLSSQATVVGYKAVLLGDLNEWFLWGRPLRRLHRYFKHTPHKATFPSGWPFLALDRVWTHPRSLLKRIHVHRTPLSRVYCEITLMIASSANTTLRSLSPDSSSCRGIRYVFAISAFSRSV